MYTCVCMYIQTYFYTCRFGNIWTSNASVRRSKRWSWCFMVSSTPRKLSSTIRCVLQSYYVYMYVCVSNCFSGPNYPDSFNELAYYEAVTCWHIAKLSRAGILQSCHVWMFVYGYSVYYGLNDASQGI